jgi:Fic family protein
MFIALLHQAHDGRQLSEQYLVELQNSVLTNPFDEAFQYRTEQNWLRGPARGAPGVTYVPPPPEMVGELMNELVSFANTAPREVDPIVAASVASFGFVFIHPFLDGNG